MSTTIVVVTYDRPEWCEVALRSALATADGETRVLLLDNAGPENYAIGLAARYGVDHFRMAENSALAVPVAFSMVDSTYAAILYDDDALAPEWLPRSLAVAEGGCDVVAASYWNPDAPPLPNRPVVLAPPTLPEMLAGRNPVNDGALIRMSALDRATWHPERGTAMFFSLWLDLLMAGARFGVVPEPSWFYRRHPGQMSRTLGADDARWRAEAIAEYAA